MNGTQDNPRIQASTTRKAGYSGRTPGTTRPYRPGNSARARFPSPDDGSPDLSWQVGGCAGQRTGTGGQGVPGVEEEGQVMAERVDEPVTDEKEVTLRAVHSLLASALDRLEHLYETGQSSRNLTKVQEHTEDALFRLKNDGHKGRWAE